jgi:hypothetical protein
MALSAARASLRDEAPERGPRRMLDVVRVGVPHTTRNSCIGEWPVIYQGAFRRRYQYQPDSGTSLGLLPAAYRGPVTNRPGSTEPSKHVEEPARHCTHAKTPPGESIGLPRSSTGSERVAGFGYRSPWWRVRGVRRPGVFEESLVPPAPDPRGTVPPPVTGVPARTRRASPYSALRLEQTIKKEIGVYDATGYFNPPAALDYPHSWEYLED